MANAVPNALSVDESRPTIPLWLGNEPAGSPGRGGMRGWSVQSVLGMSYRDYKLVYVSILIFFTILC
jgi:hypothetical protein